MAKSRSVRAAADLPIRRKSRGTVSLRQNCSHRFTSPSAVSLCQSGQSISCRMASSRAITARSRSRPNRVTRARAASLRSASRSRSTSSVNSNSSVCGLGVVEHAEAGVDAGLDGVAAQQRATKRVDRADPGRIEVADQIEPIVGLFLGAILQAATAGSPDAVAHFAGGPLGEGDGDKLIQARPPVRLSRRHPVRVRPGTAR